MRTCPDPPVFCGMSGRTEAPAPPHTPAAADTRDAGPLAADISRGVFWLLSLTWGLPMTLAGSLTAAVIRLMGVRPHREGYCFYFALGEHWGGLSMGPFIFTDRSPTLRIRDHEHGHSIQNCRLGLLMPFAVNIPSAARYWYREFLIRVRKRRPKRGYDDIWFERRATELGTAFFSRRDFPKKQEPTQ